MEYLVLGAKQLDVLNCMLNEPCSIVVCHTNCIPNTCGSLCASRGVEP